MKRRAFTVSGQVQGVGFRPFVWRLANGLGLCGSVGNTELGVRIEVQGDEEALERFRAGLDQPPPLAVITGLDVQEMEPVSPGSEDAFRIEASRGGGRHTVLISPDVAVCPNCLAEMNDPADRRHAYAFTNCTDCGPRYTITRSIPYDRAVTSMACFPMCPACREEYENPASRRFHAQPNACPKCGPKLWLQDAAGQKMGQGSEALRLCVEALSAGSIVAVKGLGGFHLACNAADAAAVARLRRAKNRPHKALALMVRDVEAARRLAHVSPGAEQWLQSPARPIVLCPLRKNTRLAPGIGPDTAQVGLMLPGTPLHYLLFPRGDEVWVMTSGNAGGDPLCLGNREALRTLGHVADLFLCHDRDILIRVDDSVLQPPEQPGEAPLFFRRARGFVPQAIALEGTGPCVLAVGAELKSAFCLTRGAEAFVSQHLGDMSRLSVLEFFRESVEHLSSLLRAEPEAVICDAHPDYLSTGFAEEYAASRGLPLLRLRHHEAHIRSVLAEHRKSGPALGLALDGSGLGEGDAPVWGGELLLLEPENPAPALRLGRLQPFALAGGEAAILHPWRIGEALWPGGPRPWEAAHGAEARAVREMLERGINSPGTSSCGRLFDAVSAGLGLCFSTTYEGQAALLLEQAALSALPTCPVVPGTAALLHEREALLELDSRALFAAVLHVAAEQGKARAALYFHQALAAGLASMAARAARRHGVRHVALAGGVMQNALLRGLLRQELTGHGLECLLPVALPPGDGGLCLGQAVWGRLNTN